MLSAPISNQDITIQQIRVDTSRVNALLDLWAKTFPDIVYQDYCDDEFRELMKQIDFKDKEMPPKLVDSLSKLSKEEIESEILTYLKKAKKVLKLQPATKDQIKAKNALIIAMGRTTLKAGELIKSFRHQWGGNKITLDLLNTKLIVQWFELFEELLHEAKNIKLQHKGILFLVSLMPNLYSNFVFLLLSAENLTEINKYAVEHYIGRADYWIKWINEQHRRNYSLEGALDWSIMSETHKRVYYGALTRLAFVNNNIDKMEVYLDLMRQGSNSKYYLGEMITFYQQLNRYYAKTDEYYKIMYYQFKLSEMLLINGDKHVQQDLINLTTGFKKCLEESLVSFRNDLKAAFPHLKFKLKYEHELLAFNPPSLIMYLPMDSLPQTAFKLQGRTIDNLQIVKVFNKEKTKNGEYTGIQIRIPTVRPRDISGSLHELFELLYPKKMHENNAINSTCANAANETAAEVSTPHDAKEPQTEGAVSSLPNIACSSSSTAAVTRELEALSINEASAAKVTTSSSSTINKQSTATENTPSLEACSSPSVAPVVRGSEEQILDTTPKTKRNKQGNQTPSIPAVASNLQPSMPDKIVAKNVGFTSCPDAEITPVYPSKEAQKRKDPCIFVRIKHIEGASDVLLKKLSEMLNPTEEGIVTVGTYGEAGPKIWKYPNQKDWRSCALRFKFLGTLGKYRVIAEPEEKVEVNGKPRYLFSLGYLKQK